MILQLYIIKKRNTLYIEAETFLEYNILHWMDGVSIL